jgi:hypothetical protein
VPTAAILNQERERWARLQSEVLAASMSTFAATTVKQTNKTGGDLNASMSTFSGILVKQALKILAAAMSTFAGTLIKQANKILAAAMSTFAGILVKQALKILVASMSTFAATIIKQTNKVLTASMSTFIGLLVASHLFIKAFTASMSTFSGALTKQTSKIFSAAMSTFAGVISKQALKVLIASMTSFTGAISKQTFIFLVASMSTFSGGLTKFTQKIFSGVMSLFDAVVSAIKQIIPIPPVFEPIFIGHSVQSFGVSVLNPALIMMSLAGSQLFSKTVNLTSPFHPTADGWGNLGQRAMASELLTAPGNGSLSGKSYYVAAGGTVNIPSSAINAGFGIQLFENYFSYTDGGISIQSDLLATIPIQFQISGQQIWSLVCRLSGNGRGNGILVCDLVSINGNSASGRIYTNRNPFQEPTLQFSIGAQFVGTLDVPNVFQAQLMQFEFQQ